MLTAGVENERRSLARELHDDTLQALIALNQNAQMAALRTARGTAAEKLASASSTEEASSLLELQNRIAQTITNLRRVIGGLRPIYLEDLGLVAALGMLVREMEAQANGNNASPPEISLHIEGEERRLAPEVELALYRIAQEGLNNALHHADAHHIRVTLEFQQTLARLSVIDDGQGFHSTGDPNAFARQGHFGLLGMRERADLAGAGLAIQSHPGEGTSLVITWEA
jgi:signal transduction histidine kinase